MRGGAVPLAAALSLLPLLLLFLAPLGAGAVRTKWEDKDALLNGKATKLFSAYTKSDSPVAPREGYEGAVEIDIEVALNTDDGWDRPSGGASAPSLANKYSGAALLFHSSAKDAVGVVDPDTNERQMCCWDDDCPHGVRRGGVLVQPQELSEGEEVLLQTWDLDLLFREPGLKHTVRIMYNYTFPRTGVWRFWVVCCGDEEDARDDEEGFGLEIEGTLHFTNPFGELPGAYFGYLVIFWWLFAMYVCIGLVWAYLCYKHRRTLLAYQRMLLAVMVSAALENFIFGVDYALYNDTGEVSLPLNVFGVLFSTTKRTIAFLALMLASYGWGIITRDISAPPSAALLKWVLGQRAADCKLGCSVRGWVGWLTGLYFVFSGLFQMLDTLNSTPDTGDDIEDWVVDLVAVPDILLGFAIILFIFNGLFGSVSKLKAQETPDLQKIQLFMRIGLTLVVSYLAGMLLLFVYVGAVVGEAYDTWWPMWWLFGTFWSLLHFTIMFVFALMLRPSRQNASLAYAAVADKDESRGGGGEDGAGRRGASPQRDEISSSGDDDSVGLESDDSPVESSDVQAELESHSEESSSSED